MSTNYLFGYRLIVETFTNIGPNSYTFYCPIYNPTTKINICIWSIRTISQSEINFFSAYDNGKHINPKTDHRFKNTASKYFLKNKPWTECSFNNIDELLGFLMSCNI